MCEQAKRKKLDDWFLRQNIVTGKGIELCYNKEIWLCWLYDVGLLLILNEKRNWHKGRKQKKSRDNK